MIFLNLHMDYETGETGDILCRVIVVCKEWKTIVENSRKLQQMLFFQPISATRLRYFPDMVPPQKKDITGRWATSSEDLGIYRVYAHPLLNMMSGHGNRDSERLEWEAIRRPEASWRRALATQPAAVEIEVPGMRNTAKIDAGVTLSALISKGFIGSGLLYRNAAGFIVHEYIDITFKRKYVWGDQEFERDDPAFADLHVLLVRPHKAEKISIDGSYRQAR